MIALASLRRRPVYTLRDGKWSRQDLETESTGASVKAGALCVPEDQLVSIAEITGTVGFAYRTGDAWAVFDFSASHLCPNQLEALRRYLCSCS